MFVFPNPQVLRADSSLRQHCRCFRDDEGRATDGTAAEMHEMPVIREAVDARILAHGRNADPIAQPHVAQFQRREELRRLFLVIAHSLGILPSTFEDLNLEQSTFQPDTRRSTF